MKGYSFGYNSFHFHEPKGGLDEYRCLFNAESMGMKLKDGTPLTKQEFENITFDPNSNTFKGTLNFGRNPWIDYHSMDFTLVFSKDYD